MCIEETIKQLSNLPVIHFDNQLSLDFGLLVGHKIWEITIVIFHFVIKIYFIEICKLLQNEKNVSCSPIDTYAV